MSKFGSQTIAKSKCLEVFFSKILFKKLVVKVTKSTTSKPLTKRLKSRKIRISFLIKVAAHKNTRSIRESHLNLHLQRAKDSSSQRTDQRGQENFSALVKTYKAKVLRHTHIQTPRQTVIETAAMRLWGYLLTGVLDTTQSSDAIELTHQ